MCLRDPDEKCNCNTAGKNAIYLKIGVNKCPGFSVSLNTDAEILGPGSLGELHFVQRRIIVVGPQYGTISVTLLALRILKLLLIFGKNLCSPVFNLLLVATRFLR